MTNLVEPAFALPPTVRGYLTDAAMRTAVDALLDVQPGALPPELRLDEFGDYLAARAAAELTRYDWAIAMHGLWSSTWGSALHATWRPATMDEIVAEEFAATPQSCWNERSFSLYHVRGPHTLYTAVAFDRHQTQIAFSIETDDDVLVTDGFEGFVWQENDDWAGWLVSALPRSPGHPDFALAEIRRRVDSAMTVVEGSATVSP